MEILLLVLVLVVICQFFVILNLKSRLSAAKSIDVPASITGGGENVTVQYNWKLDSARNAKLKGLLELTFNTEDIRILREANPYFIPNPNFDNVANLRTMYQYMLSHPITIMHIAEIVKYINRECSRAGVGELDKLQFVLDFVQEPNIKYIHDDECEELHNSRQYIRFPDETLFDKHGDCDCKSFLAASIFHVMGYNILYMLSCKLAHAAICIEYDNRWKYLMQDKQSLSDVLVDIGGRRYVFCETTSDGFRIGGIGEGQSVCDFETVLELRS